MKGCRGFVLLAAVIFLQIFAFLGITALEEVFWHESLLKQQKSQRLLMNKADSLFQRIERGQDFSQAACRVQRASLAQWINRSLSWWQVHACGDKASSLRAYYAFEYLGSDPCAQIRNSEAQPAYFRVSVLVIDQEEIGHLLQATTVKPVETRGHCEQQRHSVDLGQQSWREV